jgi:hypothetical protein
MRPSAVALLVALGFAATSRAGLYNPAEPFVFELDSEGTAKPMQYPAGFETILKEHRQITSLPRTPEEKPNRQRQAYLDRVAQLRQKGVGSLAPEELAGYTADLIRLTSRQTAGDAIYLSEALNLLQPLARDPRRGGFLANAHLAVVHAYRGEWREAADQQQQALLAGFPESFAKLTPAQMKWLKHVEREYYLPLLVHRAEEARSGRSQDRREELDPLFKVRFVGEAGKFTPGGIAPAERAKLPKDAIAVVEQILLWHPYDARLFWLLGELYNATGDLETASSILEECSYAMSYTNPNMMEHRQQLKEAAATVAQERAVEAAKAQEAQAAEAATAREQQAAEEQERRDEIEKLAQAEREYQKRKWKIIGIAVALGLVLVYYQSRELLRRLRRSRKVL